MKSLVIAAAFAATLFSSGVSAQTAPANSVTLDTPYAGVTLGSEEIPMSVYFTRTAGNAFEVVATYLDAAEDQPQRIVLALSDGDNVRFGLPGHVGKLYEFARNGEAVTVSEAAVQPALSASSDM